LAGGHGGLHLEKPAKIVFVLETDLLGYFLDGLWGLGQQIAGAHEAQLQQILVGARAGVLLKGVPE